VRERERERRKEREREREREKNKTDKTVEGTDPEAKQNKKLGITTRQIGFKELMETS